LVHKDDIIVEVMTDKVTVQIPSPFEGEVTKLYYKEGEIAKVGTSLLEIGGSSSTPAPTTHEEAVKEAPTKTPQIPVRVESEDGGSVLAPPAVRKLAREKGIELSRVKGTGPGGRITARDVESYVAAPVTEEIPAASKTQTVKGRKESNGTEGTKKVDFGKDDEVKA